MLGELISWRQAFRQRLGSRGALVGGLLVVLALASFTRLDGLGNPNTYIADEGFYAPDGCLYVHDSPRTCDRSVEASPEHPPLGKWLIGVGIKLDGYRPSGWRLAPAIAGILTVVLLFFLALRLFRSVVAATFTAGLLAVEPLHVVQSRIATLDVFVTCFGVAAFLFAVLDYQSASARRYPPWRLAAGVAAGAAVASKWSGLFALAAVVTLTILANRRALARTLLSIAVTLGLTPLLIYVLSYVSRLHGEVLALPWSHDSIVRVFVHHTASMWRAQTGHFATSAYQSPPWSWPLLRRPTVHYAAVSHGQIREVIAVGNPLIWWIGFVAFGGAVIQALRTRGNDMTAVTTAAGVGFTFLPWLVIAHGRSFVFIYYMTPAVPFLCLAVGWAGSKLVGRWRVMMPGIALASLLLLIFWWPILTANPTSFAGWRERVVFHDCRSQDQPQHLPPDSNGVPGAWLKLLHGPPPSGWCWV
jgi:dolichyl-phosphate-mannose-protein mannosyltransferase